MTSLNRLLPRFTLAIACLWLSPISAQQLDLLDGESGSLIQTLVNNQSLELNDLGTRELDIRYSPKSNGVQSIAFRVNGKLYSVDNAAPFRMGGMSGGSSGSWLPGPGAYSIQVIEYDGTNGTGSTLFQQTLNLTVSDALKHRMRTVRLETGLPNTVVRIRMQKHAFPFGSMVKASNNPDVQIFERDTLDEQMYQDTFLANFNASVAGNAMKWYTQQPDWWSGSPHNQSFATPGEHRYDVADNILDFLESQNIPMRGHTIYWGEIGGSKETPENQMQDPNWVEALGTDSLYWIEQRAKSIVGRYAGRIDEWDFNNELWHGDWYRRTFGTWITKQMAEWALEANPDIKLWFNEYAMLTSNSNAEEFKLHLETLISEGVPVDGVGVQAHFSSLPDAATVKASLDILDDLGRPIKLTEFDCGWNGASEAQEANGLEIVYRTAFEHPAVEGIIMWGFWEGNHWKPERALWLTDWTPTQQALRYRELVYDEWWTDSTVVTAPDGTVEFAVFAGDYAFEIDGSDISISISAGNESANLVFAGAALNLQEPLEVDLKRPVDGNTYARNQPIEFLAELNEDSGPIGQVEFYANGILLKRDTVAPYTATWTNAPDGESQVQAIVRDGNGIEHTSDTHSIQVTWGDTDNILANPDFEIGLPGWTSFGPASLQAVTDPAYQGIFSARSFDRTESWHGIRRKVNQISQRGQLYDLNCWIRLSGQSRCVLNLKINYTDGSDPDYTTIATVNPNPNEWTKLGGEYVYLPDDGKEVQDAFFYVAGADPGIDIFVDAFHLRAGIYNHLDTDVDGMPDAWEVDQFGGLSELNSGPSQDWDFDGVLNRDEYRAGTDPTDSSSKFVIDEFTYQGGTFDLGWQSVSGKSYRIVASTRLLETEWVPIEENINATSDRTLVNFQSNSPTVFFQVHVDE